MQATELRPYAGDNAVCAFVGLMAGLCAMAGLWGWLSVRFASVWREECDWRLRVSERCMGDAQSAHSTCLFNLQPQAAMCGAGQHVSDAAATATTTTLMRSVRLPSLQLCTSHNRRGIVFAGVPSCCFACCLSQFRDREFHRRRIAK